MSESSVAKLSVPTLPPASVAMPPPKAAAALPDDELLELIQRQTFHFFWEGAHPGSGLAPDRRTTRPGPVDDLVAIGGSGFAVMVLIVAVERGWVTREAGAQRLARLL